MSALAIIRQVDKALALLEQAETLEEVLPIRDLAAQYQAYTALHEKGTRCHVSAYKLSKLANRKMGEITAKLLPGAPGRHKNETVVSISQPPVESRKEVLGRLGVTNTQARRAEQLAEIPLSAFYERLEHAAGLLLLGKQVPDLTRVTANPEHKSDEYGTPSKYVAPARELTGGLELDFSSNMHAASIIGAARFFTKEDSALVESADWSCESGWFQPPFSGALIKAFCARLVREVAAGRVREVFGLTNLDPSTAWWRDLAGVSAAHVLCDHRIAFLLDGKPIKGNAFTQWFFYFGPRSEDFLELYSEFGTPCRTAYESAPAPRGRSTPPEPVALSAGADVSAEVPA